MIGACANALVAVPAWAQAAPESTLTRLDCVTPTGTAVDLDFNFSDTFRDNVPNIRVVLSCYLIKHGDDYVVWYGIPALA
jgi:N-acyl homoserine lactone hydrolase